MKSLIELYNKTFFQILQRKLLPVSISPGRFLMFEIGKKVVVANMKNATMGEMCHTFPPYQTVYM